MRGHISVFMLYIRSSVYRVLCLLALMAGAEFLLFWQIMEGGTGKFPGGDTEDLPYGLERIFDQSLLPWCFGLMAVLLTVLLVYVGCDHGGKQGYTLQRLSISEKSVFVWQAVFNTGCYFLLWMTQVVTAFALCQWYLRLAEPDFVSNQTIFLAFYRSKFLHGLLPLAESSVRIRNVFMIIGLGCGSAYFPYLQRRGKFSVGVLAFLAVCIFCFPRTLGVTAGDFVLILASVLLTGWDIYKVFGKEGKLHET